MWPLTPFPFPPTFPIFFSKQRPDIGAVERQERRPSSFLDGYHECACRTRFHLACSPIAQCHCILLIVGARSIRYCVRQRPCSALEDFEQSMSRFWPCFKHYCRLDEVLCYACVFYTKFRGLVSEMISLRAIRRSLTRMLFLCDFRCRVTRRSSNLK